jgi:hypothetical protein
MSKNDIFTYILTSLHKNLAMAPPPTLFGYCLLRPREGEELSMCQTRTAGVVDVVYVNIVT